MAETTIEIPIACINSMDNPQLLSKKGPIAPVAVLSGILGAKATPSILPLCHPLPLTNCTVDVGELLAHSDTHMHVRITVTASSSHSTGVEMEALMGACTAALAIYDMLKALSHDMVITRTRLLHKSGGKRTFDAEPDGPSAAQ